MADNLEVVAPGKAPATQETNPAKAVMRTILAAVIAFFPLTNGVLLAVQEWLTANSEVLPSWLIVMVNGILLAGLLLVALVTRILAVPGVNDWLRKYAKAFAPDTTRGRHAA